jgi:hypothetical protein
VIAPAFCNASHAPIVGGGGGGTLGRSSSGNAAIAALTLYTPKMLLSFSHRRLACRLKLLVLETKGKQFEGSADTKFKSKFFDLLEEAYTLGHDAGEIELFADAPEVMRFRILIQEEAWKSDLEGALAVSFQ